MSSTRIIDFNCDMGESFGIYKLGSDREICPYVTSASLACGFHAADPLTMEKSVTNCIETGVEIGAHPSVPDLVGFGERAIDVTPDQLRTDFIYQISALRGFVEAKKRNLQHVKPHGMIYHQATNSVELSQAIAESVMTVNPQLILVVLAGSKTVEIGKEYGLKVAEEGFADRGYNEDGTLVSTRAPGARIEDPQKVAARFIQLATEGTIQAITGKSIEIDRVDTICVHGHLPSSVESVKAIINEIEAQDVGIDLVPLRSFL